METEHPNVIFLLADDLGYGDVQYNGGVARTPNLNEMANGEHSVRFERFYSSAPVCSPTRGSLLTGRNHNRFCLWMANTAGRNCKHGDFLCHAKHPLPHSEATVAEILREQGYKTAAFGKWHLGDLISTPGYQKLASNPGQNGFDTWKVTERSVPTSTPNCGCFNTSLCNLGHYRRSHRNSPPCTNYHEPCYTNQSQDFVLRAHPEIIMKDDSDFIVGEFSKFLEKAIGHKDAAARKAPFFAYIPFHSVHKSFVATPPYDKIYNSSLFSQEQIDYYASISAMDNAVGEIRRLLHQYDISDNTMLWFASDNGPAENTPGSTLGLRGRKGSLYEGGIRVPGIVEWPAIIKRNKVSRYPVTTSDFVPTVIDALGLQRSLLDDPILDGTSILPVLRDSAKRMDRKRRSYTTATRNDTIKWAFNVRGDFDGRFTAVIMDNKYKLIANLKKSRIRSYSLYDLDEDPAEMYDISQKNLSLSSNLMMSLEQWLESVKNSAEEEVGCLL